MPHRLTTFAAVAFGLLLSAATLTAAEPSTATDTFTLRYVSAEDAVKKLTEKDMAKVVKAVDPKANTIDLDVAHDRLSEARLLLVTLDQRPEQVLCLMTVVEVNDATGEERIVARPSIFTLSGKEAVVTYSIAKNKTLKFQVTPRIVK